MLKRFVMYSNNHILILMMLIVFQVVSCKSKTIPGNPSKEQYPKIEDIDNLRDDQGNYVFLNAKGKIKVNDFEVDQAGICQALLNQQAFHWSVVLSPSKSTKWDRVLQIEKDIRACYDKYLLVVAVDMYDKAFSALNEKQQANVREVYPLHLIITAARDK